jgi:hypothetical protein
MYMQANTGSGAGKRRLIAALVVLLAPIVCGLLAAPAMASAPEVGSIEGKVTDASTHAAIGKVEVCALESKVYEMVKCVETEANGEYTLSELPVGKYKVEFFTEELDYITQYYNAKPNFETADEVPVTSKEPTTGVDAEMHMGGLIKGEVTDASTHSGIGGVVICAIASGGGKSEYERCVLSVSSGEYTLPGLPAGEYKIEFTTELTESGEDPYLTQYYNGKSTLGQAETVTVTVPGTVSGISAELQRASTLWPANIGAPQISGSPMPGDTLFCSTGSWTNSPIAYSYKWLRNGVAVAGQTSSTFVVQGTELGATLACQVTAINARGSGMATSDDLQVQAVTSVPPPIVHPKVKCKRGFKKKLVHGKEKCVKVKKKKRGHR